MDGRGQMLNTMLRSSYSSFAIGIFVQQIAMCVRSQDLGASSMRLLDSGRTVPLVLSATAEAMDLPMTVQDLADMCRAWSTEFAKLP